MELLFFPVLAGFAERLLYPGHGLLKRHTVNNKAFGLVCLPVLHLYGNGFGFVQTHVYNYEYMDLSRFLCSICIQKWIQKRGVQYGKISNGKKGNERGDNSPEEQAEEGSGRLARAVPDKAHLL